MATPLAIPHLQSAASSKLYSSKNKIKLIERKLKSNRWSSEKGREKMSKPHDFNI